MNRAAPTLLCALFLASGCGGPPGGAQPSSVADAKKRTPEGARIFERQCAACHGKHGEGVDSSPPLMGPTALPTYAPGDPAVSGGEAAADDETEGKAVRQPFRNAEDLHAYVKAWMPLPKERIGSLRDEEYWAVVNFILIANRSPVPPNGVNAGNASTVSIR